MTPELWAFLSPKLLPAFWTTIQLSLYAAIGSLILGVILVAMRVSPVGILRSLATLYINIAQNLPLTLVVLFASLGLYVNLDMSLALPGPGFTAENNFRLGILALVLYTSAFVAEALRAGINTVPFGQAEAARSLGFSFTQNLRYVVLPQAFRGSVIPLGNTLIALIKNSTVVSIIGVAEASLLMKEAIEKNADQVFVIFGLIALGFMILTLPTGLIFGSLGKRMAVKR